MAAAWAFEKVWLSRYANPFSTGKTFDCRQTFSKAHANFFVPFCKIFGDRQWVFKIHPQAGTCVF